MKTPTIFQWYQILRRRYQLTVFQAVRGALWLARVPDFVTNTALGDGVAPDKRLMRPDFPYFGEPHASAANSAKQ